MTWEAPVNVGHVSVLLLALLLLLDPGVCMSRCFMIQQGFYFGRHGAARRPLGKVSKVSP